jgi:pyruvate/2-oxoacid:ferredoxin oxidoreductase alpha subunit
MKENETRFESYQTDDAVLIGVSYGIVSRVMKSAVERLRNEGKKVGMLRPITLFPFPEKELYKLASKDSVKGFFVSEMSEGQMIKDVRLATEFKKPIKFFGRMGGNVPTVDEIYTKLSQALSEV